MALAIGVASFALIVVLGMFGGLLNYSVDNEDRRATQESVDSLRNVPLLGLRQIGVAKGEMKSLG